MFASTLVTHLTYLILFPKMTTTLCAEQVYRHKIVVVLRECNLFHT